MKRTLIITLLLLVAAFSFSQTNATFNNLDVRNTTKLRGLIYPIGAVATSPINTAVHEIAMINNTTFALCRMDFEEFADSIANYLNPIIGTHWYSVPPDTIKTIYNVVVDSSFVMSYDDVVLGYTKLSNATSIGYSLDKNGTIVTNKGSFDGDSISANESSVVDLANESVSVGAAYITNGVPKYVIGCEDSGILSEIEMTKNNIRVETTDIEFMYGNFDTIVHISCDGSTVAINGDLTVTGQIKYDYIHLVAYTSGGSYTPNTVSNVEFKLAPTFTTAENDGFTFAGDTVTIITHGDYMVQFSTVFQGANGDDWLFKCRKNGTAITSGNLALTTTGAGNYCSGSWFWYLPGLAAGDDISFSVTNEGANNDPTFRSLKIYVDKKPE